MNTLYYLQHSPVSPQKNSISPQKSLTYPEKSPVCPKNSFFWLRKEPRMPGKEPCVPMSKPCLPDKRALLIDGTHIYLLKKILISIEEPYISARRPKCPEKITIIQICLSDIYINMCVYIYICIFIFIYVCMCVCLYLHICSHARYDPWHRLRHRHTAICMNELLQHTATRCNTFATHCNTPQHIATQKTHCNTPQHTAIHRHTLRNIVRNTHAQINANSQNKPRHKRRSAHAKKRTS